MYFPQFCGPSYRYNSHNFDVQRSINVYPVKSEVGNSKAPLALEGTPGISAFITFPKFPGRGGVNVNGRVFAIFGNGFYEIFTDGSFIERGTFTTSTGAVSIAESGNQVVIVTNPEGFVFDLTTDVFAQITDGYYLGAVTVTFDTGSFVFNQPDSQVYFWSAPYDGTTGDSLDFASAEGLPDNLVGVQSIHGQVWLFGASTIQVVQNTGDVDLTYQTVQGSLMMYGCASPYSIVQSANIVFWMGQDNDGNAMVWSASGYQPKRISTHAIEQYLSRYSTYISDTQSFSYQEDGHYFIVFMVPTMPTAIVWDVELEQWHERGYFSNGMYSRPRQNFHIFAYGRHLVGDYETGILYQQSLDIFTDNGQNIRRLRTAPYIASESLYYVYHKQFWLDMQSGIGLDGSTGSFDLGFDDGFDIGDELDPGINPQIGLRWSNDGGHTWSQEYLVPAGKIGEYNTRALWNRLGRARQRAYEVTFTPPCKVFWMAAHVDVEEGTN